VGVGYGAHPHEHFEALNPLFVAHSVPELQAWLLAHA
jgi:phosphoglycolate phosphatase